MTLRKLTSLVIFPVFLLTFVAVFLFFNITYVDKFKSVEKKHIEQQTEILMNTTMKSVNRLKQTAVDWGVWDDTYDFIQNKNQDYIKKNLLPSTLLGLNIDGMYFTNTKMETLYSVVVDNFTADKNTLAEILKTKAGLLNDNYRNSQPYFFMYSQKTDTVYLAVMGKVTDSNMNFRPNGYIFMIQSLQNFMSSSYDNSGYNLVMHDIKNTHAAGIAEMFASGFTENKDSIMLNLTSPMINTDESLILTFQLNRDLFKYINEMVVITIGVVMLIFIAAALLVTILMNVFVLKRIKTLTIEFRNIKDSPDFDRRLQEDGVYELKLLATTANRALDDIRSLNKKLLMMTNIDGLTGIPNRRFFNQIMDKELKRAARNNFELSVLMMDIDYFKSFNDAYGHLGGDECLKAVARTISGALQRPADFAARFGGEEFIIILPETSKEGARHIAENIRKAVMETPVTVAENEPPVFVTVSIGISTTVPEQKTKKESLIENADIALYNAKKERNCTVHFGEWK